MLLTRSPNTFDAGVTLERRAGLLGILEVVGEVRETGQGLVGVDEDR